MIRRVRVRRRQGLKQGLDQIHPVVGRVLAARGATALPDYSLAGLLPPALSGLKAASELLARAIVEQRRILVVGDFDADGATGTALAVRGLRALGARDVHWSVPDRFEHGYGLSLSLLESLRPLAPDLIMTVDQGISSLEGVQRAVELGMEVLITDHHLPGPQLPPATAIVNPNLAGERFGSTALAGVGVVLYVLMALRTHLRDAGLLPENRAPRLDQWLDLVALGTVADLVPLDENNRRLVHQGLLRLRAGRCLPGVRALLEVGGRNLRHLQAADLGFVAAPRLNAAGRLDDMSIGIRCLLTDSEVEARALAEELDGLNRSRRSLQAQMQDEALERVDALMEQLSGRPDGVCLHDPGWHAGVVGLVAGRVAERLNRPVIAFAPAGEGSALLKGSGRSPEDIHMRDLLVTVDQAHPGLMQRFGGHARAAGLTLSADALDPFRSAFLKALEGHEFAPDEVLTDGALDAHELSLETAEALAQAGPWGQAWPEPLFDGHFSVLDRRVVGQRHLKLRLAALGGGPSLDAIAFGAGDWCHRDLPEPLHVTYALEINRWRGQVSPQLRIQHLVDALAAG